MIRRFPLDDARFRTVLLVLAGTPIALFYVWRTLVLPLLQGTVPGDFGENYMAAAARIAAGRDPYDLCAIQSCGGAPGPGFTPLPLAGAQYVTPPSVAWMLQPLVHAGATAQLLAVLVVLQLSLGVFLWATLRALGVRGWQMAALLVLLVIGFEPVAANFDEGQVNLVLLGLSGIWLLGWVAGDRWWGGAALGAAVAIIAEGALAFLGLSAPGSISWGNMIAQGQAQLYDAPQAAIAPMVAMFLTIMSLNFVGERLGGIIDPREAQL